MKWTSDRITRFREVYQWERGRGVRGCNQRTAKQLSEEWPDTPVSIKMIENAVRTRAQDIVADMPEAPPSPPDPVDPTDERVRTLERRLLVSQDKVSALSAKLRVADRKHTVVSELVDVMEDNIQPIIPSATLPSPKKSKGQEPVDAVVMLSDQHADRIVRTEGTWGLEEYDFLAFRCRLAEWAKMIQRYTTKHLPNYFFETLWIWHLGDSVNGDIHNMKQRNFFKNSLKASIALADAQAQAIEYLAPHFKRVAIVCVSGNHGRTTKTMEHDDPTDSFDYVVAKGMQLRLANVKNVDIFTPESWSANVDVRGHLWHLNHGHGVIGSLGIPWYGFERREGRVQRLMSFKDRAVDYFAYGHYHTAMTRAAGRGKAIHAGSWYMTDPWAQQQLSVGNEPEQQLIVTSERFGRQIEIPIMVRDKEREIAARAGDYEPPFGRELVTDGEWHNVLAPFDIPIIK
jgi:hypothetical protein